MQRSDLNQPEATPVAPEVKVSAWAWVVPAIFGFVLAKLFGLVGAFAVIGSYFLLKPKLGTLGAVIVSVLIGFAVVAGFLAMLQ